MSMFDRQDLDLFRSLVRDKMGLNLESTREEQIEEILQTRMRETESSSLAWYCQLLQSSNQSVIEFRTLAKELTVGETYFFRHPEQLRAFADVALPERIKAKKKSKHIRILSAGCATGEEPYTVASIIRDVVPYLSDWNISILGIDINGDSLEKAQRGVYYQWSLREVSDLMKRKIFHVQGKENVLIDSIRNMVRFEERNLINDDPHFWQADVYDIIFCRNVLMYFSTPSIRSVIARFARALAPDGYLFLGPAETLRGISQRFHLCHSHDAFYYRNRGQREKIPHSIEFSPPHHSWTEKSPPPVADLDASWVEVICRASERIARLAQESSRNIAEGVAKSSSAQKSRLPFSSELSELKLARQLFEQERYDETMAALQTLPPELESNPDVYLLQAIVLTNRGRIQDAEKICEQLLEVDEFNAGAHYLKALCREHSNDPASAIQQDQIAVYLDSAFAMPHLHLGLLSKQTGDMKTFKDELNQAISLLELEDPSRILLFGGGFSREALIRLCRSELDANGEKNG